ncbi:TPA: hypothetical protein DIS56_00095 [Candidatus Saccharibacteria bacterium]|nr:MAG: hypothetical protein A3F05_01505 [Candidatus Saccharibacteria bacterium RIFCSPHIGHO2_12_FULL_47_17]HCM51529.1 hypothetical protein [Candidatus Saccharibacteria bacterium]
MHIYFSGIGGTAMGPLALIAKQAGYEVSGSDKQPSQYIDYLKAHDVERIHVGQTAEQIAAVHKAIPIDWLVYTSAVPMEDPNHPELVFAKENSIKTSKRDELTNKIISDKGLKLITIAGTHGKTTTTAMAVWLFKQLGVPISYSVGAKVSFGDMGAYDPKSQYFILEADEFDRNFLSFHPYMSLITGIDWDHPDIYPSRDEYYQAFRQFIDQSEHAALWQSDVKRLDHKPTDHQMVLDDDDPRINQIKLTGQVNRQNAWLTANSLLPILNEPAEKLAKLLNDFPGLSRRFEEIAPGLYSDYAHTPGKIRGALQMAHEAGGNNVVVVYEGLHNLRQHFIKEELKNLFDDVKHLYIVPSYLAREDQNLKLLAPADLLNMLSDKSRRHAETTQLDNKLKQSIQKQLDDKNLVLCLTAGGGGSLDEWLRQQFQPK